MLNIRELLSGTLGSTLLDHFRWMLQLREHIAGIHFGHGGLVHAESNQALLLLTLATSLWARRFPGAGAILVSFCCSAHVSIKC